METENDDAVRRPDGSAIVGLTRSEWEKIKEMYPYLTPDELICFRDMKTTFDISKFEDFADYLNAQKRREVLEGRRATDAASLFMLLSVHVKPRKRKSSSFLSVCGEIFAPDLRDSSRYMYRRELEDVQHFESSDGGYLTLSGPPNNCIDGDASSLFETRELSIRLYDQQGQQLYPLVDDDDPIILDYSPHDFEHVKVRVVQNTNILLTLNYVSIPMAVHGLLGVRIFDRQISGRDRNLSSLEDVHGKVVANYRSTFGNYTSQEIVLFDKNPNLSEYERINLGMGDNLLSSSRCWVVAPAFSLLHLRFDLFNSGKEPILTRDVVLGTGNSYRSAKKLISGKYYISVYASWASPVIGSRAEEFGHPRISRFLIPEAQLAIEIFSILVCYEKHMPLQIHGRLRFTSDWTGIDIFKREKEEPLILLGRGHTITELEGSRLLTDSERVEFNCDLDGTARTSGLSIRGYETLYLDRCRGRQLCSIFQGDNGFAALHYAVFTSAVQANLKVYGSQCEDVSGSICAQYRFFDYSSQYKKNCYRIVLFKSGEDLVKSDDDGLIPLSRSSFVVPLYTSVIFDFDLMIGIQKFRGQIEIAVGDSVIKIIGEEFEFWFGFELGWSEVK